MESGEHDQQGSLWDRVKGAATSLVHGESHANKPEHEQSHTVEERYTDAGQKPPVSSGFNDQHQPSASEIAFDQAGWISAARKYNANHPSQVESFVAATHMQLVDGQLDPVQVASWQTEHGLDHDGKVGPATVGALHKTNGAAPTEQHDEHEQHDAKAADKKAEPTPDLGTEEEFTGEQKYSESTITRVQRYDAISKAAGSSMSHDVKLMMVGQSLAEQGEKRVINNNFMGFELADPNKPGKQAYVKAWTSTIVPIATYKANPSKYKDWSITYKNRNTISQQLERNEKDIWCMTYKNRQAYKDVDSAAVAFVHNVKSKIEKMKAIPKYQKLVEAALGGDAKSYAEMVETVDVPHGLYAYNGVAGYIDRAQEQIAVVRADPNLKDRE
jgi:hypothetical protein